MMMARAPAVAIDLIHHHEAFLSLQHGAAKPLLMWLMVEQPHTPGGMLPQPRLPSDNWFKPVETSPDLFFTAAYQHMSQSVRVCNRFA
jgi:hypothetical protein